MSGVISELGSNGNEIEGDQKGGQGQEPEGTLPTHGLESGDLIFGDEFFFVDHLSCYNHLCADDQYITCEFETMIWSLSNVSSDSGAF